MNIFNVFLTLLSVVLIPSLALSMKAKTTTKKPTGTEMVTAARQNDHKLMAELIDRGGNVNTHSWKDNQNLLFIAAQALGDDTFKLLLAQPGIDVYRSNEFEVSEDSQDSDGFNKMDGDLVEWSLFNKKESIYRMLVYLGYELQKDIDLKDINYSPQEEESYKNMVKAIGANNGKVLTKLFIAMRLIKDNQLVCLMPLIGEYMGLGLMVPNLEEAEQDAQDDSSMCTIS